MSMYDELEKDEFALLGGEEELEETTELEEADAALEDEDDEDEPETPIEEQDR